MKKIGIVGATGYTGVELIRLLAMHSGVEVSVVTSRGNAGSRVDAMFPNLRGHCDCIFSDPSDDALGDCDLVFFATPNGIAMEHTPELLKSGVKVIDLAADFRIKDVDVWSQWYGMTHVCPELLETAVYGLPEINREQVKGAQLVANPGCYPTAVTLGLLPLIETGKVDIENLIADVKSGISGAGRQGKLANIFSEAGESFKAYATAGHRHQPEIVQTLEQISGASVDLTFSPHLLPIIRGIHATLYTRDDGSLDLQSLFERRYEDEFFVDVLPSGSQPETRSVKGSNMCRIAMHRPGNNGRIVVLSVIDNLVKGAAGQAVQNMNLMLGFDETEALRHPAMLP